MMNSTSKDDSEVRTNMMIAEFCFSFQSSALHFTRTYFSINKNENHYNFHYFYLCPGPGVRWVKRSQPKWKSFCLRFEMYQLCSRRERLFHQKGGNMPPVQSVLPESLRERLVSSWSWSPQYKIFQQLLRTNQCSLIILWKFKIFGTLLSF